MVLGDSSLYQNPYRDGVPRGNYKMNVSHSRRQADYLRWKRDVINAIFHYRIPVRPTVVKLKNGKEYAAVRMQTRTHSRLTFIAKRIYVDRKKRITPWALQNITLEGLAYWWMDDGSLHLNTTGKGGVVIWGVYGYPLEDVEFFQSWLIDKFDIHLNINKHHKSGWSLRRGISEGHKICDLLLPYAVPSMRFKFEWQKGFSKRTPYALPKNKSGSAYPLPLSGKGDDIVHAA